MDFTKYLPHMDAADGIKRVMGNQKLYVRLIGKFNAPQMVEDISRHLDAGDFEDAANICHALRGTAANLSFPNILNLIREVEARAKAGQPASDLLPGLCVAAADLAEAIVEFISSDGA